MQPDIRGVAVPYRADRHHRAVRRVRYGEGRDRRSTGSGEDKAEVAHGAGKVAARKRAGKGGNATRHRYDAMQCRVRSANSPAKVRRGKGAARYRLLLHSVRTVVDNTVIVRAPGRRQFVDSTVISSRAAPSCCADARRRAEQTECATIEHSTPPAQRQSPIATSCLVTKPHRVRGGRRTG